MVLYIFYFIKIEDLKNFYYNPSCSLDIKKYIVHLIKKKFVFTNYKFEIMNKTIYIISIFLFLNCSNNPLIQKNVFGYKNKLPKICVALLSLSAISKGESNTEFIGFNKNLENHLQIRNNFEELNCNNDIISYDILGYSEFFNTNKSNSENEFKKLKTSNDTLYGYELEKIQRIPPYSVFNISESISESEIAELKKLNDTIFNHEVYQILKKEGDLEKISAFIFLLRNRCLENPSEEILNKIILAKETLQNLYRDHANNLCVYKDKEIEKFNCKTKKGSNCKVCQNIPSHDSDFC